jgi:TonB family protein
MRFFGYLLIFLISFPGLIATGQEPQEALPKVVRHDQPIYPPLARTARIEGEVHLKITTDGESISNVEVQSGHPILTKAAEENVRTWKFASHLPGAYSVTYQYKLMSHELEVEFLQQPAVVQLLASPPELHTQWGYLSLGTWKAQLKSAHGKYTRVFNLSYSGPHGEWLAGSTADSKGNSEEIDEGYINAGLLGFMIDLAQPDGKKMRTFFTGKILGAKILGAFVDNTGITGEWTAVRTR